jgi:hypothetical protein
MDTVRVNVMACMPTAAFVEDWIWETSRDHRGLVPRLNLHERCWWILLCDKRDTTGLDDNERRVLAALDRKIRYRAERDLTEDM